MKFTPQSADEIAAEGLLPAGVYDCIVETAEDAISKTSGAEMIKLRVRVYTQDGSSRTVFDYLMPKLMWKLRHAAETFGLIEAFDAGELNAIDFEGREGRCKLRMDPAKDGYEAKNSIQDYVVSQEPSSIAQRVAKTSAKPSGGGPTVDDLNDAIPFAPCWQ